MSTSVNIFRSSGSSSSSDGGGGGQTIVSAVGKAVYKYDYIEQQWYQIQPLDGGDIKHFNFENDQEHDIAVTVDGNVPQEGNNTNILLGVYTDIGDTLNEIFFLIEIEGEVFEAEIEVSTPYPLA